MNLQNMAPNAKRSLLMTLVFGAIAAVLYFFAIESTEETLAKTRRILQDRTLKHHTMAANLSRADAVAQSLANGAARLAAYEKEMIVPLLESTAMRAKALVDPLAAGCGLVGMEYEQETPIALPIFGTASREQYVRCPVKMTCRGSYQAGVSFVQCVEKQFPFVALEAFSVTAGNDPDLQQIAVILEWPMKKGAAK